ncbi:MAG: Gfo/Idh/MocA family oxidoreductase [Planctomycetes bacterium]|nr:Gfo/Idh/MocA family oxidoreductase [Planctomycetota bacterium]
MTIRWGIIGCGNVTERKSGPAFQKAEGSSLVAVMRRDRALAEDYARRHGVPRWCDDADALVGDPEVDAVYVATPPGNHLEQALRACAAGKPCYVEKPMARNADECRRMVEAFARAGVPLFVAYYRRALPRFLKVKEILDTGRIGAATVVSVRFGSARNAALGEGPLPWRLIAEHSGGGLFLDLGCHTLDILDFLLGPLDRVTGSALNRETPCDVEDFVAMSFRTPADAIGLGHWSYASAIEEDWIEIAGTEGQVSISTFGEAPIRLERRGCVETLDIRNPEHIQQPFIQTMVDALRGRGTCASTGESAARTSQVMDRVLEGYYGGRDDAFWLRPLTWPGRRANR